MLSKRLCLMSLFIAVLVACAPTARPIIPTDPPTATASLTPSPISSERVNRIPTLAPIFDPDDPNAPTATSLFGATRTPIPPDFPTATRAYNATTPRIDYFSSDPLSVAPGDEVTLYWSTRNVDAAVIYRVDQDGIRSQVYNVVPDGNLTIDTDLDERGSLRYVLSIGRGADAVEELLVILLECPNDWFFVPVPADCANDEAVSTQIIDMQMERGRFLYVESNNTIYALFNDGAGDQPAWLSFENRFDPDVHASREENAPPEWIQPLNELGYVWRGNGDVRNRLGLGLADAIQFEGFIQNSGRGNRELLYISGSNGVILQLEAGGDVWQIIGAPR